jgi:hypothetical protein
MLMVAWLMYTFDPWLGLIVGALVSMCAIVFATAAVRDARSAPPRPSGLIALADDDENEDC